ncbi:MAG: glucose-6-phosphate isomerase [Thermodesulfobacteriota bacterium]
MAGVAGAGGKRGRGGGEGESGVVKKNEALSFGELSSQFFLAIEVLKIKGFTRRLWARDPGLWKNIPDDREIIENSLGWLTVAERMGREVKELKAFASSVKKAGFRHVVVLGMGGSSLAPLVLAAVFGRKRGWPELRVLDSTDPAALRGIESSVDPARTLFIVSSKSGTTVEPLSFFEYFYEKVKAVKKKEPGKNFIAITDPGSHLEGLSKELKFRRVFLNPPDIGGRYSALSYFGLVPAVLAGIDIKKLLASAAWMGEECGPAVSPGENPGVRLGAALGAFAMVGRDKVTFLISKKFSSFALWIEQLLAESTGKQGRGLVPIAGEPEVEPGKYGSDRVFVVVGDVSEFKTLAGGLKDAGHPVITLPIETPHDLGGEFLRWEIAAATAGCILGINPFDQPDVEEAKKRTKGLLEVISGGKTLSVPHVVMEGESFELSFGEKTRERLSAMDGIKRDDPLELLKSFLGLASGGNYLCMLAYADPDNVELDGAFSAIRRALGRKTGAATQFGYGPRYLHSTGQLHKGGRNNGVFLIFTHVAAEDLDIPGRPYTFSGLELSQALGDLEALEAKGRSVALVNLKSVSPEALEEVGSVLDGLAL